MIYFYLCENIKNNSANYEHQIISLAEGLKELGVRVGANIDYWYCLESKKYLLEKDTDLSCYQAIVFSPFFYLYNSFHLIDNKMLENSLLKILIDASDGLEEPRYNHLINKVDIVLKCHYSSYFNYPNHFTPWQFGLTNRIIEATKNTLENKKREILINFRVEDTLRSVLLNNNMEEIFKILKPNYKVDDSIIKEDEYLWKVTGKRHNTLYYARLKNSLSCAAFGGELISKDEIAKYETFWKQSNIKSLDSNSKKTFLYRFDSFRFWEALSAGSCVINVDFGKYKAVFPIMPIAGKHYVGIDIEDNMFDYTINDLVNIAKNGTSWVMSHYTPYEVAKRFLNLINL